mgnify:CR=1 FL=1
MNLIPPAEVTAQAAESNLRIFRNIRKNCIDIKKCDTWLRTRYRTFSCPYQKRKETYFAEVSLEDGLPPRKRRTMPPIRSPRAIRLARA